MVEDTAAPRRGNEAQEKAREVRDHPALSWMARLGFVAYGVVYLVIGLLAAQLAFGQSSGKVSGEGALHELAQQPWGEVILVVASVALAALTVWELLQVVAGHTDRDGASRLAARAGSAGRAVVFGTLAFLSAQIVLGSSSSSGGTDGYTAQVMKLPAGPAIVVAVGLGIIALGGNSVHKGLSDRWRRELESQAHTAEVSTALGVLARAGFCARGIAFLLIGGLFVWAGLTHDADRSAGLDQALHELRDAPYGPWLLCGVAVGLAAYGVFNMAKAWALRGR